VGGIGSAKNLTSGRRPASSVKELDGCNRRASRGLRGRHVEKVGQRKHGTSRRSPRRPGVGRTARAVRISRFAVKSCCACEWGGWGRVSDDGPGHYNPDRSEDPWGRAVYCSHGGASAHRVSGFRTGTQRYRQRGARRAEANARREELADDGKAPPDIPALKP
jgi:hypothetical protein